MCITFKEMLAYLIFQKVPLFKKVRQNQIQCFQATLSFKECLVANIKQKNKNKF